MKRSFFTFLTELRAFFSTFLPKGKTEILLFAVLLFFYISYAFYIVFNSSVIDSTTIETDIYFSFDNPLILKYGRTQISGHPLLMLFYYPFVLIGNALVMIAGFKAKTILFVLLSSSMISMSCVYINRYLKEIVEIKASIALLLTLFFAFFSTNLILSFTPESFTLSAFFLSFNVYYYSSYIKKETSPPFLATVILSSVFLGGVTITNFAKGVVPTLFLKAKKMTILKRLVGLGLSFVVLLCCVQIICDVFLSKDFFGSILVHQGAFTPGVLNFETFFDRAFTHFFGAPIFFPELVATAFYNPAYDYHGTMIAETGYNSWWEFLFSGALLMLLITSFVRNCKNRFVLMILLLFLVDITIHLVLRFGIVTPYIYGAHWIYCVPLVLGWLYKSLNGKSATIFSVILVCMFIGLVINNFISLVNFISLASDLFPTN